ncbi:MAG TPA: transporter substrate-binding domain-containing protein [Streptosporangiaceae bacterium]|nr:transporter substrate-binding domain-containing protein [Streptosporangiaceae bacterium]
MTRARRQGRAVTTPGVSCSTSGARRLTALLAALASTALLAGCTAASAGDSAGAPAATAAAAGQAGASHAADTATTARAAAATGTSGAAAGCNPYASLAPQAGGPAVTAGSWAARIRVRGYLIAGVDQTTYHFGYLDPLNGQIEGLDIDMIKDVAAAIFGLGPGSPAVAAHIHFKAIDDAQRIPDVQQGIVDIVAHTMTVNCDRMKDVDFSSIYYDAKQRVLVDAPAAGATAPDLARLGAARQKVCATSQSDSVAQIKAAGATAVQVPYWSDCLVLLEEGQVAGISTDDSILYGMQAQDPDTVITGPSLEDEPYGLAISRAHPDFVRFVNAVLAADRANGQWAKSYRTWVSASAPLPTWPIDYAG